MYRRDRSYRRFPRSWDRVRRLEAGEDALCVVPASPAPADEPAARPSALSRRLLAIVFGLLPSRAAQSGERSAPPSSTPEGRLRSVAFKLEAILDELDALGAQRIAIDVCMALERVREKLAADDAEAADPQQAEGFEARI